MDRYTITVKYTVIFSPRFDKVHNAKEVKSWIENGGNLGLDTCRMNITKVTKL